MTSLREAAQAALEAMDHLHRTGDTQVFDMYGCEATEALRAALAEDALQKFTDVSQEIEAALAEPVQEPVAWMVYTLDGKSVCVTDNPADFIEWRSLPLYTAPPQRKPLTEEEIEALELPPSGTATVRDLVRLIERAHGIGGQQ